MKIVEIELNNFRKYTEYKLKFSDNMNILVGSNASGKTTVLEAIHLLITARSHKTIKDCEMINIHQEETVVKGHFKSKKTQKNAIVLISKYFKKMSINGSTIKKASQYIGFCRVVLFSNIDVYNLQGSPSPRRKMLDFMISQVDSLYLEMLKKYKNLIKEKNVLLKNNKTLSNNNLLFLDVLNDELYVLSQKINNQRLAFLNQVNKYLIEINRVLSSEEEDVTVLLKQSLPYGVSRKQFNELCLNDMKYRTTCIGPHRDDLVFKINDMEAIKVASQGQLKTMMISFKLAFVEMLKEKNGENPIVLLDDVFGELDIKRQNKIIELLRDDVQVIITTPSLNDIDSTILENANIIKI